jgi:hypothetical protein
MSDRTTEDVALVEALPESAAPRKKRIPVCLTLHSSLCTSQTALGVLHHGKGIKNEKKEGLGS